MYRNLQRHSKKPEPFVTEVARRGKWEAHRPRWHGAGTLRYRGGSPRTTERDSAATGSRGRTHRRVARLSERAQRPERETGSEELDRRELPTSNGKESGGQTRSGGGRGIRTPGRVTPSTVFKTAALNRSAIPPFSSYAIRRRFAIGSPSDAFWRSPCGERRDAGAERQDCRRAARARSAQQSCVFTQTL